MPSQPEVIAIFGRRGSGKTTCARSIADRCRRVVVFDPLAEWRGFKGYRQAGSCREVAEIVASGRAHKLAYVPPPNGDQQRAAHCLAAAVWKAQEHGTGAEVHLIVDEANLAYPVTKLPRDFWGLPACLLQGRHKKIGLIAISQRPALVSLDLRANAHRSYWFAIAGQDRRAALQTLPADDVQKLSALSDHQYLVEDRGRVSPGQNAGLGPRSQRNRRASPGRRK